MKIQKKQEIEFFGTKTGNANSIALGYATETKNFGEVAVGIMNKSTAAKDPNSPKGVCVDPDATLFSVGYGGSGERKNALEVKGNGSVIVSGENGDINVADKIKQALDTDASIKLVRSAENNLQYTLMVNDESRGSIDIPKDQFLKNVTYDSEGKQLVFTFVTLDEDEHVEKVPVGDLKDVYKAGEGITINGDNVISADFSSVMTAISDEKTQRETTDNEIKSTLDTKADKSEIMIVNRTNNGEYATIQTCDQTSVGFGINSDGQTNPGIHVSDKYGNVHIDGSCVALHSDDCDSGMDGFFVYFNEESETKCGILTPYGVICSALPQKDTDVLTTNGKSVDLTEYALKSTLDAKADASAIPTNVSQLTNDLGYIKTNDAAHLDWVLCKGSVRTKFIGKYSDGDAYLVAEDDSDRVANKVFAADGSLFDVGENLLQIGHPADNVDIVGLGNIHIVHNKLSSTTQLQFSDENISYEDVVKLHTLPSITGKLSNITAATTTEDMITKFNDLLADLKAKGYMTADVTT